MAPFYANAVECELLSQDIWNTGFSLEYRITNTGSAPIDEWRVSLDFPAEATVETQWGSARTSNSPLIFTNATWNGSLGASESTVFGFSGSKSGEFSAPPCNDASQSTLKPPVLSDAVVESTSGNYGFVWEAIEGAVKYQVMKTELDENGDPTEWELSFETTNASAGFGNNVVGHYGIRVNQCNADNVCSDFSNIKTAIVYKLNALDVNSVTGNYKIEIKSPFPVDLLENGDVIQSGVTTEIVEFNHRDTQVYEYQLSGLNKIVTVEVDRFDPTIDIDRTVFVHDVATLDATGLDLAGVMNIMAGQFNDSNTADPIDGETLFARMWDAQNPKGGTTATAVEHCTETLNGFPMTCRPQEGAQALAPADFIERYRLISLVNRLDLRDRRDFTDCGEARAIYALTGGSGRNLLIFEAQLPNPRPGVEAGCLPIAQFWHSLNTQDDPQQRAALLRDFYLIGLPEANVAPVFEIAHFSENSGQIRTNQFIEPVWVLKEYKAGIRNGLSTLFLTTVKNNPFGELFDIGGSTAQASVFRDNFANGVSNLIGGLSFIKLPAFDDQFNNNQSHSSGALTDENDYLAHFANSRDSAFDDLLQLRLSQIRSDLTVDQIMNRAAAMTCGGCHQPARFGLTGVDAVGPNQRWPNSLGFVHVSETPNDGVFPLSEALTDVFLPDRRDDFESYLSTEERVTPEDEIFIDAPDTNLTNDVETGDRSG